MPIGKDTKMNNRFFQAAAMVALASSAPALAQSAPAPAPASAPAPVTAPGTLTVQADKPGATINRDIFGQFAEHLGTGIYALPYANSAPLVRIVWLPLSVRIRAIPPLPARTTIEPVGRLLDIDVEPILCPPPSTAKL